LGKERSYLWVVSSDGFNSYELPGSQDLAQPIEQFHNAISHPGSPPSDIKRKGDSLVQLILPEPVWAQLAEKRLLVVANGDLQTIPFAALPIPNTPEYAPLLKNNEILTQPSASSIAISRQQLQGRTPAPKTLAILADPVYRSDDPRVTGETVAQLPVEIASTLRSFNLPDVKRLPNTRTEAEQILALVPDSDRLAAFDFAANYDWATDSQLSQYRIVHFATHGFVNPVNPALSGVVLSLVNERGRAREEGLLRLHDIFNLNLPAELVVLSACQTGLGEEARGEGLIGLTRGFMFAGAKRLVVSLWNVNDEATATLMSAFYRKVLQENMTPAVAMRSAQLEMWEAGLNPNLWAAFTVQGEWRD
ncbi:MAG: CHAT domain-containing protein, partial [Cyanobacteriota bacterium]|nr:CHAT domain-containing protein [Cyanobacteriota bacterium]